jgi:hypothetical protein
LNKTKVNYWSDVFTHLKPFDELGRDDLVPLYDKVNDYISSLPKHNRYYFSEGSKPTNPANEYQNEDKTWLHYHLSYTSIDEFNNTTKPIYFHGEHPNKYSLKEKDGHRKLDFLGCGLVQDARSEQIYDGLKYVYLEFPKEIVMNNLTNLSCWDIAGFEGEDIWDEYQFEKIKKYVDDVESTGGWTNENWVSKLNQYDKLYPDVVKRKYYEPGCGTPPYYLKWRINFYPEWYISIKDFGLMYPIITKSVNKLFADGIHRLVNNSLAGTDTPYLLKVTEDIIDDNIIKAKTPHYFDKQRLYVEVNLEKKSTDYYIGDKHIGSL